MYIETAYHLPIEPDGVGIKYSDSVGLPHDSLRSPEAILRFVHEYLPSTESPRTITHHFQLVRAAGDPELLDRYLRHGSESKQHAANPDSIYFVVVDDTADTETAEENKQVALQHGAYYFRTKGEDGFSHWVSTAIAATEPNPKRSKMLRRITKGALTNHMQLDATPETFGGYLGAYNTMLLVGTYLAGVLGAKPNEFTLTCNDDDIILKQPSISGDKLELRPHDRWAEVAAWLKDPFTKVITGKYLGHCGNPVAMVYGTLQKLETALRDVDRNTDRQHVIYDPVQTQLSELSSREVVDQIEEVFATLQNRVSMLQFMMPDEYILDSYVDSQRATSTSMGDVTHAGLDGVQLFVGTPMGIQDITLTAQLRAYIAQQSSEYKNRAVRQMSTSIHSRKVRRVTSGATGDCLMPTIGDTIKLNKVMVQLQMDLQQTLLNNRRLQALFRTDTSSQLSALSPEILESLFVWIRVNKMMCEEIERILLHIQSLLDTGKLSQVEDSNQITTVITTILEALADTPQPASAEDRVAHESCIRQFARLQRFWPEIVERVYTLGAGEKTTQ